MKKINPFHLSVPVYDLEAARLFYTNVLNCEQGRCSDHWIDLDLYGHQFVIHLAVKSTIDTPKSMSVVDKQQVPVPHFGVVLDWDDWTILKNRLIQHDTKFIIEPYVRFKGEPGEQATMFFLDPSGNALEFKAFKDIGQLFAK